MADLRALVESLGFADVQTLLNSGNVVFTAPPAVRGDAAARIERAIADHLGVSSRVTVLTGDEIQAIVEANPLLPLMDNPSRMQVAVLFDAADSATVAPLAKTRWSPEVLALGRRVAYVWCPEGVVDSAVLKAIGKAVRHAVTVRTWSTMLKLLALSSQPPAARPGSAPRRKER